MKLPNVILMFCILACQASSQNATAEAEFASAMESHAKGEERVALEHLKQAVALDPEMTKAYFAIGSIADQWCSASDSEEMCALAVDGYKKAMASDPSREDAWKRLAFASHGMNRPEEAESDYRRALALDANDPEALGGLAAIEAYRSYRDVALARVERNVAMGRASIDSPSCEQVRQRNLPRIEEGIALLTKARQIKNKNGDLMSFLYVLYLTRAEIQCGNLKGYKDDISASKRWNRLRMKAWKTETIDQHLSYMPPGPPPPPPSPFRRWVKRTLS
jgi:tetratricopeptide (TPR) repeat protein